MKIAALTVFQPVQVENLRGHFSSDKYEIVKVADYFTVRPLHSDVTVCIPTVNVCSFVISETTKLRVVK